MSKIAEEMKQRNREIENWVFQVTRVKDNPSQVKDVVKRILIEGERNYEKLLVECAREKQTCLWCDSEL